MNLYPYSRADQRLQTDVDGVDVKRSFIADFYVSGTDAVAASAAGILAATALTSSTQSIATNITNPAVPRNVSIFGNVAGIAGDVVITGTNYLGVTITETLALNGTTTVEGSKAFKTITQIDLPVETNAGTDTVSVGFGNKLGLNYLLARNTVDKAFLNDVLESTAPTVTCSTSTIESNTIELNSALNGSDVYVLIFV